MLVNVPNHITWSLSADFMNLKHLDFLSEFVNAKVFEIQQPKIRL